MKDKKRVNGRERIEIFGKYVLALNSDIDKALADNSPELYRRVLLDVTSNENNVKIFA